LARMRSSEVSIIALLTAIIVGRHQEPIQERDGD
jgi:hypothetical protein